MYSKPTFILNDIIKFHYLPEINWFVVTYFWDHLKKKIPETIEDWFMASHLKMIFST